ncbi:hypothetical protein M011DRAFT_480390 [Sporormia fimetaria CBS 119925]|uniref:Lysine-specific metallo-endopeptidase domain-containing protein n=1 Tax=Sporormia fimetaria CBS 119925 TaxID=1340428 RepID=A0A6A6V1R8_9PLEO|nr:hypothetical protein M011DRAFT_480390 [Sporormia fimetaria CBS 119925]
MGLGLSEANSLKIQKRAWHFTTDQNVQCNQERQDTITTEIKHAKELADQTVGHVEDGEYYTNFFSQNLRDNPSFAGKVDDIYKKVSKMLDENNKDYDFEITCDNKSQMCKDGFYAHMNDKKKRMNFCDSFFTPPDPRLQSHQEKLDKCDQLDLRDAQFSRSAIIIHECTHTAFAMDPDERTLDYAYGYNANYLLPRDQFDRSCAKWKTRRVLCPDANDPKKDSFCKGEKSAENADTYSFVAAGVGFSKLCKRDIPLPAPPSAKRAAQLQKRACPADDWIQWDDGPDEEESAESGTCKLDITEIWTCEHPTVNLYGRMTITSPDGTVLYNTGRGTSAPGVKIGDEQRPVIQKEGMSHGLQVIAQHTNDYIQFYYDDLAWTTGTTEGPATCKLVGDNWDTSTPVECNSGARTRQFECKYTC